MAELTETREAVRERYAAAARRAAEGESGAGCCGYYYVNPEALEELSTWLS